MRLCLILRQGASPLRPPAPFPSTLIVGEGRELSRVRKPRQKRAPLTILFPLQGALLMRERGPLVAVACAASRWSAPKRANVSGST